MRVHPLLKARLEPLSRRRHYFRLSCRLAGVWGVAALAALAVLGLQRGVGWFAVVSLPLLGLVALAFAVVVLWRHRSGEPDWRAMALEIEKEHPELQGRLITAVQQDAKSLQELDYLQQRVIEEALAHARTSNWRALFPGSRVAFAMTMQFCALALFGLALWQLRVPSGHGMFVPFDELGISVTPGDVELERGSALVVAARFKGTPPARVDLVVGSPSPWPSPPGEGTTNRAIQLVRSLADPLFGGSVSEVGADLSYHLEYGGKRTRDYLVKVFDYPRLERADADVRYPDYTGLSPKRMENTRRISAVEGSRIDLQLQLNKPVATACLVSRDTNRTTLKLEVATNSPSVSLSDFVLAQGGGRAAHGGKREAGSGEREALAGTYELLLCDAEGRTNKLPAQFVFDALKNRPPELKVTAPRGDTQPSALEELAFAGTVYDDFGVQAFGLASAVAGREITLAELGQGVPGKEKRAFSYLLRLEELGLQENDLMSWFVWADDIGPDGKTRRTTGDLFFAEVRPFEEVFREGQSLSQEAQQRQQQQQQAGEGGAQAEKLADLQKQIINATWKLFRQSGQSFQPGSPATDSKGTGQSPRDSNRSSSISPERRTLGTGDPYSLRISLTTFLAQRAPEDSPRPSRPRPSGQRPPRSQSGPELADDMEVVRSAQEQALTQAEEAGQQGRDPRTAELWAAVAKQMERALEKLRNATNSPAQLQEALAAEQAAYQALLKLQEREFSVSRSRSQQSSQSSRQQQRQRQLDQLDLSQEENRYESERQAQPPQSAERSEQLQVMNRLQELARRQQDLNERLKEMQTALQEARTEAEREEIRRELKRLQEEQQEILADADEVRQRMERPENQSRMSEQSRQMDQARSELQRAAEAAQQGQTSQALASGTRAQRQLQQMRDDMRRANVSEFEQELRQMRSDARELARQQEEIQKKVDSLTDPRSRNLSDANLNKEALEALAAQRQRLTNLVEQATQLSRETETSEPLVSSELYETLRRFSQNETSTAKQVQEEFLNRPALTRNLYERLKQTTEQSDAKSLDLTAEMLRIGLLDDANLAEERARAGIEDLRRGVERAAQNVLGDDTQSLRLAGEELNRLAEQLQREIARGETGRTNGPQEVVQAGNPGDAGQQGNRQGQPGQDNWEGSGTDRNANQDETAQPRGGVGGDQPGEPRERAGQGQRADRNRQQEGRTGQGGQPQSQGQGNQPGEVADQQRQGDMPDEPNRQGQTPEGNPRAGGARTPSGQNAGGGGNRFSVDLDRMLSGRGGYDGGPITGEDFAPWSDGLREVEELMEIPSLRTEVTRARERARQMRQDYRRNQTKPDWAAVRLQILKPLVEVRNEINEELARREPGENLVPIDRDPVPGRYSEMVRRYYERLGKDDTTSPRPQSGSEK